MKKFFWKCAYAWRLWTVGDLGLDLGYYQAEDAYADYSDRPAYKVADEEMSYWGDS